MYYLKEINFDLPKKSNDNIINDYINWFKFWVNIKNELYNEF